MSLSSDMSPADIRACTGGNSDTFGGSGLWMIVLFLIFGMFGWGGFGGFGGWGNGSGGVSENYVLASDFATLQRQIDSGISSLERKGDAIQNGICDGFYAQNSALLTGFGNTDKAIMQGGYETRNAIQQNQITDMQGFNAMQAQLAQCCCDNKAEIADMKYAMAIGNNAIQQEVGNGFCQQNYANATNTRDIIDAMNNGFRALDQKMTAQELAAKDAQIADKNQQLFMAQLAASQAAQNETLKGYMNGQFAYYNPRPVPSFTVPNPYNGCGGCYGNC
nr:MAG TPA: hypothetical protein [Caudoviricetes sp.]